jgi:hypothetical protein
MVQASETPDYFTTGLNRSTYSDVLILAKYDPMASTDIVGQLGHSSG